MLPLSLREDWVCSGGGMLVRTGGVSRFAKIQNVFEMGHFGSVDKLVAAKAPDLQ